MEGQYRNWLRASLVRGRRRGESGSTVQLRETPQHWSKKEGAGRSNKGGGKVSQEVYIDSRLKILKPSVVEACMDEGGKTCERDCYRVMGLEELGNEGERKKRGRDMEYFSILQWDPIGGW